MAAWRTWVCAVAARVARIGDRHVRLHRRTDHLLLALRACADGVACLAFWAVITAIAVSQHGYLDTRKLSRDQFIGAMVGGLCGLAGAVLGGGHFAAYAATVALAILVCSCVNVGSAARLGGVTATIMLLTPGTQPPWDKALIRLGEVTLGTLYALLVSWLIDVAERRWFARK